MLKQRIKRLLKRLLAHKPFDGVECAKQWGKQLQHIGQNCHINHDCIITDPDLVSLGDHVTLASCSLICHDGVIEMLNCAYGKKLDAVGPIIIGNYVFVGHQAVILRNTTIEDYAIVAAGAVVTGGVVRSGDIVGGVPARPIGKVIDLLKKLEAETQKMPWAHLIYEREGSFDPKLEPALYQLRTQYFFGKKPA